jgi:Spy/CpxP family protein refolding chaperone
MRKVLLTAALAGLLVLPVFAQFRPGMMGRMGGDMLLLNKSVQDELKLTKDQKSQLEKIQKAQRAAFAKAREAFKDGDADTGKEIMEKAGKEATKSIKKVKDTLTTTQAKRFTQIQIQVAGLEAYAREDVQKALKLTDKQKDDIKDIRDDLGKDIKDLMEDARGDREKFGAAMKKIAKLRADAQAKITKSLTDDQKKAWKDLTGEPFTLKMDFGGGRRPRDRKKDF